ncbi:unnamed protein product [Dibothriocephalus latus]|uniref:EF-hand domain-containing protein n=1 Tax=Dibothriocephalus latus TaxID=60516 RepID=A0A3P7LND7_DIBLA|nr:unnamed protein product [Dibothriocephalus latus]
MVALMDVSFQPLCSDDPAPPTRSSCTPVDTSGTLGFEEFKKLWFELRLWQTIYKRYDPEGLGLLKSCQLREVLSDTGIHVSNQVFKAIVCRYVDNGQVLFDDYILLVVRLITVFATFKERARPGRDRAEFTPNEVRFPPRPLQFFLLRFCL